MDMLRQYFPYSFTDKPTLISLFINVILYMMASSLVGFVVGIIPLIGGLLSTIVGLYCTIGWVLSILDYLKVLKS